MNSLANEAHREMTLQNTFMKLKIFTEKSLEKKAYKENIKVIGAKLEFVRTQEQIHKIFVLWSHVAS